MLGEGARAYVVREFGGLGANLVVVVPGKAETTGGAPPLAGGVIRDLTELNESQRGRGYKRLYRLADVEQMLDAVGLEIDHKRGVYTRLENLKFIQDHFTPAQLDALFALSDHVPVQRQSRAVAGRPALSPVG